MSIRPRPTPDITLVFHPQRDASYVHFLDGEAHPFDPAPGRLGRRNAWWLAEAALLSYWAPDEAVVRYGRVGFDVEPVFGGTTQGYLAWNDTAVDRHLSRHRTRRAWRHLRRPDVRPGAVGSARAVRAPGLQDRAGSRVARTWRPACRRWPLDASVWFAGHSLGAALGRAGGRPVRRRHGRRVHAGRAPRRRCALREGPLGAGSARAPFGT